MHFASDNTAPVPPQVLDALTRANHGHAPPYGTDATSAEAADRIRRMLEAPDAAVCMVPTGTAANALALATLAPPWGQIFCHHHAHIEEDECGAPEFYTGGAKLTVLDGPAGRITPATLDGALAGAGAMGVHNVQPAAVSLTNVTERGAVYAPGEIAALSAVARAHDVPVHLDGARLANALAATGASPAEMTWKAGVDALSLGATKNGLMAAEAVVLFDPARAGELAFRRKRAGQLFSKQRYLAAQLLAWLEDDLWMHLARRANAAAARLADGLAAIEGATLHHEVGANMIFADLPRAALRRLSEAGAQFNLIEPGARLSGPDHSALAVRLVTSWATTDAEIDRFLEVAAA